MLSIATPIHKYVIRIQYAAWSHGRAHFFSQFHHTQKKETVHIVRFSLVDMEPQKWEDIMLHGAKICCLLAIWHTINIAIFTNALLEQNISPPKKKKTNDTTFNRDIIIPSEGYIGLTDHNYYQEDIPLLHHKFMYSRKLNTPHMKVLSFQCWLSLILCPNRPVITCSFHSSPATGQ